MIQTEQITINDREYIRTYSDEGRYVVRDGQRKTKDGIIDVELKYTEAIDPVDHQRWYREGELIPEDEATAEEILSILTGGDV